MARLGKIQPELMKNVLSKQATVRYPFIKAGINVPKGLRARWDYKVPERCTGCKICERVCPAEAIVFEPVVNGQWFVSQTRLGPMVHAKLGIAEENSGKLVSLVRNQAKKIAEEQTLSLVIIDGSPGIGCPVIASITGADVVLVVTEPTLSGQHDLERVSQLTRHFGIKTLVSVNKWDLNEELASQIEDQAQQGGAAVAGRIRYDRAVTQAQIQKLSVVEYSENAVTADIKNLWTQVLKALENPVPPR